MLSFAIVASVANCVLLVVQVVMLFSLARKERELEASIVAAHGLLEKMHVTLVVDEVVE